jgi:hypothetical protein
VDWLDGETIVFISYEGVESRLGAISPDGEDERTLKQRIGKGNHFDIMESAQHLIVALGDTSCANEPNTDLFHRRYSLSI